MKLNYLIGDATKPEVKPTIIFHCCNTIGKFGSGFVVAISKRWKNVEVAYRKYYSDTVFYNDDVPTEEPEEIPFMLGEVQIIRAQDGIYIANAIAQKDIVKFKDMPPVRYESLRECLLKTVDYARILKINTISMPRVCSDRAGGQWDRVESIIKEVVLTQGLNVDVYDLTEKDREKYV